MTKTSSKNTLERARQVLEIEAQEILSLANRLDDHFVNAVQLILHCDGRVVVYRKKTSFYFRKHRDAKLFYASCRG